MKRLIAAGFALLALAACETAQGFGQDVENTGEAIENAAEWRDTVYEYRETMWKGGLRAVFLFLMRPEDCA